MTDMPDETRKPDDVEKLLSEEMSIEERKKQLIASLLKKRETALAEIDEQLAKLGYKMHGKKRSHHKKSTTTIAATEVTKTKDKAKG